MVEAQYSAGLVRVSTLGWAYIGKAVTLSNHCNQSTLCSLAISVSEIPQHDNKHHDGPKHQGLLSLIYLLLGKM